VDQNIIILYFGGHAILARCGNVDQCCSLCEISTVKWTAHFRTHKEIESNRIPRQAAWFGTCMNWEATQQQACHLMLIRTNSFADQIRSHSSPAFPFLSREMSAADEIARSTNPISLTRFLMAERSQFAKESTGSFAMLLQSIQLACKVRRRGME
jgi:hypothetical protein